MVNILCLLGYSLLGYSLLGYSLLGYSIVSFFYIYAYRRSYEVSLHLNSTASCYHLYNIQL